MIFPLAIFGTRERHTQKRDLELARIVAPSKSHKTHEQITLMRCAVCNEVSDGSLVFGFRAARDNDNARLPVRHGLKAGDTIFERLHGALGQHRKAARVKRTQLGIRYPTQFGMLRRRLLIVICCAVITARNDL
jgi:hypothetical protein